MKKGYIVIAVLVVLSLVVSAALVPMMPETVPVHFNAAGEPDRMGSRYEMLILPAMTALVSGFMALLARRRRNTSEEKPLLISGVTIAALLTAISMYFSIKAVNYDPAAAASTVSLRFVTIAIGIMLILLGNIMPKVRKNRMVGLRTHWSMKDDETWRKSQRFGGISGVICGAALIVCGALMDGLAVVIAMIALIVIWSIVAAYMTYRYSRGA